jgi:hypothetical protein
MLSRRRRELDVLLFLIQMKITEEVVKYSARPRLAEGEHLESHLAENKAFAPKVGEISAKASMFVPCPIQP